MKRLLKTDVRYVDYQLYSLVDDGTYGQQFGTFIKMLDKVLVEGFGSFSINSITFDVDGEDKDCWLGHIILDTNLPLKDKLTVIEIKGTSLPTLNKLHRVQYSVGNTLTIALPKASYPEQPSNLNAGGVISIAPLGWSKYAGNHRYSIYKIGDVEHNSFYLRFQDEETTPESLSGTRFATVSMYSYMEDHNDLGYNPKRLKAPFYPFDHSLPEGKNTKQYISISDVVYSLNIRGYSLTNNYTDPSTLKRDFYLIGDNKTFYFACNPTVGNWHSSYTFGLYRASSISSTQYPYLITNRDNWGDNATIGDSGGYSGGVNNDYTLSYFEPLTGIGLTTFRNNSPGGLITFNEQIPGGANKFLRPFSATPSLHTGYYEGIENRTNSLTFMPVHLMLQDVTTSNQFQDVVGELRGIYHIVQNTYKMPLVSVHERAGRYFAVLPYGIPVAHPDPYHLSLRIGLSIDSWE